MRACVLNALREGIKCEGVKVLDVLSHGGLVRCRKCDRLMNRAPRVTRRIPEFVHESDLSAEYKGLCIRDARFYNDDVSGC